MQVIGAGFPRTGTTSLKAALELLGFGPCYHMFEVLTNPDHVDRWLSTVSDGPVDWGRVFDGYRSATDWPASFFWRELADAYPDAKILLSVRDPHRWYASFQTLISQAPPPAPPSEAPEDLPPVMAIMTRMRPVLDKIATTTFGPDLSFGTTPDEETAVAVFRRHERQVRQALPADRLLVFDVREGWGPLCAFLGVDAPDEPFPHLNDGDFMRRMLPELMRGGTVPSFSDLTR
jgi:hypothetical protein